MPIAERGVRIAPLAVGDRSAWQPLAEGYKAFYGTPAVAADYDAAWARLMAGGDLAGLAACIDGRVVGIAHYLFHASTWAERVCYLQDLYTAESSRGRGVASALIHTVAQQAQAAGASRLYWLTQADNATARALYDRVAEHRGFIRYDHPLPG